MLMTSLGSTYEFKRKGTFRESFKSATSRANPTPAESQATEGNMGRSGKKLGD